MRGPTMVRSPMCISPGIEVSAHSHPPPDPPSPPLGALPFKIPEWMRNERRAFWLAPIPVQSQWRAYALYRVRARLPYIL